MLWVLIRIASSRYVVSAHQNRLVEAILMSTHNIGFYENLTKIIFQLSSIIIKHNLSFLLAGPRSTTYITLEHGS